jgi:sulfur carrier protein
MARFLGWNPVNDELEVACAKPVMKLTINGAESEVIDNLTVAQLLAVRQVEMPDMVSVELNGEFVDRGVFSSTTLKNGDKVEFMYFMGGGKAQWSGELG